jgi:hypothetical protein
MRKLAMALGLCGILVVLSGCVGYLAPVMPPAGLLFSSTGAPISTNFDGSTAVASKQGSASSMAVLGLLAFGDCSLDKAARDGNLKQIHYADYKYLNVLLGVYQGFTVTVHGE